MTRDTTQVNSQSQAGTATFHQPSNATVPYIGATNTGGTEQRATNSAFNKRVRARVIARDGSNGQSQAQINESDSVIVDQTIVQQTATVTPGANAPSA